MYFTFVSFVQLTDSSLFIYQLSVFFLIIHPSFISLHSSVFIHQFSFIILRSSVFIHQSSLHSSVFIHHSSFISLHPSVFALELQSWISILTSYVCKLSTKSKRTHQSSILFGMLFPTWSRMLARQCMTWKRTLSKRYGQPFYSFLLKRFEIWRWLS